MDYVTKSERREARRNKSRMHKTSGKSTKLLARLIAEKSRSLMIQAERERKEAVRQI